MQLPPAAMGQDLQSASHLQDRPAAAGQPPAATETCGGVAAGGSHGSGAGCSSRSLCRGTAHTEDPPTPALHVPPRTAAADDLEACPICLDVLSGRPLGVCTDLHGKRTCLHYFHLDCLRCVNGAFCPQCRARFRRRAPMPRLASVAVEVADVGAWGALVSTTSQERLHRRDVAAAFKATLWLSTSAVDALVEKNWSQWAGGEETLAVASLGELAKSIEGFLPDERAEAATSPLPVLEQQETDGGAKAVCGCGQVHIRRGERVRRGAVRSSSDPDVPEGRLGTVVRDELMKCEYVVVRWDRTKGDVLHRYPWPSSAGETLTPVGWQAVEEDVLEVQANTNFSSVAAGALLASGMSVTQAIEAGRHYREEALRTPVQTFHRVRILPDRLLVQDWFDRTAPCMCSRPGCNSGVQWSSRAEAHLGREALIIKIDAQDETVLVETLGPCSCQIWYPRLAVEPAFDPDLAEPARFKVSDQVECKMSDGWERGVVSRVDWDGPTRNGKYPYHVNLDSGKTILVPNSDLIRRI